jgi:hypothetical protein
MQKILFAVIAALTISGCTWVQLSSEGKRVSLASVNLIANCDRVGRATASTLGKIVKIERGGGKLQDELLTLARNEAGRMGGNTIVPESFISNGQQDFGVYSCPR